MNSTPSLYPANNGESTSSDKLKSLRRLIFGLRAMQFDALLPNVPTSDQLTALTSTLNKPAIQHVIFGVDGTLVSPYASISGSVLGKLQEYQEDGRDLAVYSNNPDIDRLRVLRAHGIHVATTCVTKPTLRGFEMLCDKQKMDPAHTAMIGNYPVTDLPLVDEGEPAFFPLNVLVDSIPPRREFLDSWSRYFRERFFHAISVATTGIVKLKNPKLFREIPIFCRAENRS